MDMDSLRELTTNILNFHLATNQAHHFTARPEKVNISNGGGVFRSRYIPPTTISHFFATECANIKKQLVL